MDQWFKTDYLLAVKYLIENEDTSLLNKLFNTWDNPSLQQLSEIRKELKDNAVINASVLAFIRKHVSEGELAEFEEKEETNELFNKKEINYWRGIYKIQRETGGWYISGIRKENVSSQMIIPGVIDSEPVSVGMFISGRERETNTITSEITLEEGVTQLLWGAFSGYTKLRKISLPSTVKEIGGASFRYCENLASIEIPNGIKVIKSETFKECISLSEVKIPLTVQQIYRDAFENTPVESVILNDQPVEINQDEGWKLYKV